MRSTIAAQFIVKKKSYDMEDRATTIDKHENLQLDSKPLLDRNQTMQPERNSNTRLYHPPLNEKEIKQSPVEWIPMLREKQKKQLEDSDHSDMNVFSRSNTNAFKVSIRDPVDDDFRLDELQRSHD